MGNDGIFISDSEPEHAGKITWLKLLEDGSKQWREKVDDDWELVKSEDAPASANHTHENLDQLADIVTLLSNGVTGSKTVGGYQLTFNHGVLTGFEQV